MNNITVHFNFLYCIIDIMLNIVKQFCDATDARQLPYIIIVLIITQKLLQQKSIPLVIKFIQKWADVKKNYICSKQLYRLKSFGNKCGEYSLLHNYFIHLHHIYTCTCTYTWQFQIESYCMYFISFHKVICSIDSIRILIVYHIWLFNFGMTRYYYIKYKMNINGEL